MLGNPELWHPSSMVTDVRSRETREIITDLAETLGEFRMRHGYGRGIAAPQIGVQRRVIFLELGLEMGLSMGKRLPLINPKITRASREMMELWDDCFSFPGLMVRVRRHYEIDVRYLDEHGEDRTLHARGDLSELLQHEIDHLDGILATDRAIDTRSLASRDVVRFEEGAACGVVVDSRLPVAGR
ncbi:MAG: peptide deformylase [Blastocatellia bacterium]